MSLLFYLPNNDTFLLSYKIFWQELQQDLILLTLQQQGIYKNKGFLDMDYVCMLWNEFSKIVLHKMLKDRAI